MAFVSKIALIQLFSYNDDIRDDIQNAWTSNNIPIQKFINFTLVGNITGNAISEELGENEIYVED